MLASEQKLFHLPGRCTHIGECFTGIWTCDLVLLALPAGAMQFFVKHECVMPSTTSAGRAQSVQGEHIQCMLSTTSAGQTHSVQGKRIQCRANTSCARRSARGILCGVPPNDITVVGAVVKGGVSLGSPAGWHQRVAWRSNHHSAGTWENSQPSRRRLQLPLRS